MSKNMQPTSGQTTPIQIKIEAATGVRRTPESAATKEGYIYEKICISVGRRRARRHGNHAVAAPAVRQARRL